MTSAPGGQSLEILLVQPRVHGGGVPRREYRDELTAERDRADATLDTLRTKHRRETQALQAALTALHTIKPDQHAPPIEQTVVKQITTQAMTNPRFSCQRSALPLRFVPKSRGRKPKK